MSSVEMTNLIENLFKRVGSPAIHDAHKYGYIMALHDVVQYLREDNAKQRNQLKTIQNDLESKLTSL